MSTLKNLLAGSLLTATVLGAAGGPLLSPAPARAATSAELQAQIAALLAQIAALQAQVGGTSGSCYAFTTDLTLGSNGEAVRQLQKQLNAKGYVVATSGAGSVGNESTYFGGLTRVALARYQAAMGISPAAGYFGPVTRARLNASCTDTNPGGGTGTTTTSTVLKGGEASLTNFRLRREDVAGSEGERDVAFATASFDVRGGDVRVERIELTASSTSSTLNVQPWRYFDRINVQAGGRTVASVDASSRSDWSQVRTGVYRLNVSNVGTIVRDRGTASLTLSADIADTIESTDLAQQFAFSIGDRAIRVTDAAGISQYAGNGNATVSFGFDTAENGDLAISLGANDPDASILVANRTRESSEYLVFAFDLKNSQDVDAIVTDLTIGVNGLNAGVNADSVIRRATLVSGNDRFDGDVTANSITFEDIDLGADGDRTTKAELRVRLARNATTTPVSFSLQSADVRAEGVRSGDDASVSGSATSETHSIAYSGIEVTPVRVTSQTAGPDANVGSYVIEFRVKALENDVYIATSSDATGTVGATYQVGGTSYTGTSTSVLTSTANQTNGFYKVSQGQTRDFTLVVTLDPDAAGLYEVRLGTIRFGESSSFADSIAFDVTGLQGLRAPVIYIAN